MMRKKAINSYRGFTIVEVLVTLAIIVIIIPIVYNILILARQTYLEVFIQGNMQRDGMLAIERMIHGVETGVGADAYKGIHEAQEILDLAIGATATQIRFVDQDDPDNPDDPDDPPPIMIRRFRLIEDRVEYTNELTGDSFDLIDEDVLDLTFIRQREDLILINLVLQRDVLGKNITVNLETQVELRNR